MPLLPSTEKPHRTVMPAEVRNRRPASATPPQRPGRPTRPGRRQGDSGTRQAVLAAARRQFSQVGYDRTTMRSVAAEAGVDPKLVRYFFGSKQALFVAATTLPVQRGASVTEVLTGDPLERGERLARLIVELLEDRDTGGRVIGLIRAAAAEPEAARMVREMLTEDIWGPAAATLPVEEPALAVNLVATHLLGLVMARYVIAVEPFASLPADQVVALIAPILQRHLAERTELASTPSPRRTSKRARGAAR